MKGSTLIINSELNTFAETIPAMAHIVDEDPLGIILMISNNGKGRWWCTMCGATSLGSLIPEENSEDGRTKLANELRRLSMAHLQRHHR